MGTNIQVSERKEVTAKTLKVHMKVCDQFCAELVDTEGRLICEQTDDYVPGFMPGSHYGDYLILDIDVETGAITNWKKSIKNDLQEWVDKCKGKED